MMSKGARRGLRGVVGAALGAGVGVMIFYTVLLSGDVSVLARLGVVLIGAIGALFALFGASHD